MSGDHERDGSLGPQYLDNIKDTIEGWKSIEDDIPNLKMLARPGVTESLVDLSNRKQQIVDILDERTYLLRAEQDRKKAADERARKREQARSWLLVVIALPASIWALVLFIQWIRSS